MNIFGSIKGILNELMTRLATLDSAGADQMQEAEVQIPKSANEFKANPKLAVEAQAPKLENKYGADFTAFLYRPAIDETIRGEVLSLLGYSKRHSGFLGNDHWAEKHPFNFPGPFYTGESDSCGTGDIEAPVNVMYGAHCSEFIFRQPSNFGQLESVISAAAVEVFSSYSCNGNNRWTYERCKEWWRNKATLLLQLNDPEVKDSNGDRVQLYIDYLNTEAETDLRRYCFFLLNNHYPSDDSYLLPEL